MYNLFLQNSGGSKLLSQFAYLIFVTSISSSASVKKLTEAIFSLSTINAKRTLDSVPLYTVCYFTHTVSFYTQCVILLKVCNFTLSVLFHTLCNFTRSL